MNGSTEFDKDVKRLTTTAYDAGVLVTKTAIAQWLINQGLPGLVNPILDLPIPTLESQAAAAKVRDGAKPKLVTDNG